MNKFYLLILFIFFITMNLNAQGIISGRVHDLKNNEPIPFANIIILGTNTGTTTNELGEFSLTNIEPGFVQLAVSVVGYKDYISEDFMITKANSVFIDIPMESIALELESVEIKANAFRRIKESPVSIRTLSISEIEQSPGGARDISKIITNLPGVASTVAYRNDVIVRGGGSGENKFFLDDIEIPTINHFATQGASGGSNGIVDVDYLREVDFYSSAFPIHVGNATSSVLNFKLVEANTEKTNIKATLGASDIAFSINTPINDKSSLIFSIRRSYLQYLFSVIGLPFLPTYNDALVKYKIKFNPKNELSFIGLGAIDKLKLNLDIKEPDESQRYILGYLPINDQWNYTVGFKYRRYKDNGFHQFVLSNSHFNNRAYKYLDNEEVNSNLIFDYTSNEAETKFRYEHHIFKDRMKIQYGFGLENGRYQNESFIKKFINNSSETIDYSTDISIYKWSVFAQFSNSTKNERFSYGLGLRMDANSYSNSMRNLLDQFSPRLSMSYRLRPKLFLNASADIYYQHPGYTTLGFKDSNNEFVNKQNDLKYFKSKHLVAGIEYLPTVKSKMTVEGFYKYYSDYPFSVLDRVSLANKGGDYGIIGDEEVTSTGKGRAYGVEFYYRNKDFIGFNITASYTFVRSEFTRENGDYIPSAWDNKHLLNIVLLKKLKRNWDIGMKWRYTGGAPYTPYDLNTSAKRPAWDVLNQAYLDYDQFNSLRFNDYHQLDLRIDKKYFYKKWTLMFYLDIQNVYKMTADELDYVTNLDVNGVPQIKNPGAPYNEQEYILRTIDSRDASVFPTIGIIVEF